MKIDYAPNLSIDWDPVEYQKICDIFHRPERPKQWRRLSAVTKTAILYLFQYHFWTCDEIADFFAIHAETAKAVVKELGGRCDRLGFRIR